MRRVGQFWDSLSDRDQLRSNCDPHSVLKFIGSGGGRTWSRDGGAVPPEGPLLHHLVHVRAQQAKHQRVDQHAHLGRLALSVGDHGADHGQHAGQVVGHGVGNQEKEDEASNLRHLVLCTGKKNTLLFFAP